MIRFHYNSNEVEWEVGNNMVAKRKEVHISFKKYIN